MVVCLKDDRTPQWHSTLVGRMVLAGQKRLVSLGSTFPYWFIEINREQHTLSIATYECFLALLYRVFAEINLFHGIR